MSRKRDRKGVSVREGVRERYQKWKRDSVTRLLDYFL